MIPRSIIFLALLIGLVSAAAVRAQDVATPDAPASCSAEPRTLDEIATLQAMPEAATPVATSQGEPVDDETLAEIALALRSADACALVGDYERLAGSYSDEAIAGGALAEEGVAIVPGTPEATPAAEAPGKYGTAEVVTGVWLDETHVLVQIERGPTVREVRMVLEDGRWLIDSAETVIDTVVMDGAATPDQSNVLPIEVMQAVVDLVAMHTGDEVTTVTIVSVEPVEWPDAFLGCPVEGGFAAQVITPGYRVIVQLEDEQLEIHTDMRGNAVTCEPGEG
jgi:hypothetical protein